MDILLQAVAILDDVANTRLLVVGGSSRLCSVAELVKRETGLTPLAQERAARKGLAFCGSGGWRRARETCVQPDLFIARGAAEYHAHMIAQIDCMVGGKPVLVNCTDTANKSLGIDTTDGYRQLVAPGTPLPTSFLGEKFRFSDNSGCLGLEARGCGGTGGARVVSARCARGTNGRTTPRSRPSARCR